MNLIALESHHTGSIRAILAPKTVEEAISQTEYAFAGVSLDACLTPHAAGKENSPPSYPGGLFC